MNRDIGPSMSKTERIMGFLYLPFYIALLAMLISLLSRLLGLGFGTAEINLAYSLLNFGFSLIIFGRYLKRHFSVFVSAFWRGVQAVILGFALYFALNFLLNLLLEYSFGSVANPNDESFRTLSSIDPRVAFVCAVLIGPLTEESLFRGLIFGSLYPKSRIAAYVVMCLAFALIHIWQYVAAAPDWSLLLNFIQYLPGGVALGWCFEKGGSIWCPVFLHMIINFLATGLIFQ